jgi:PKD repeat protein
MPTNKTYFIAISALFLLMPSCYRESKLLVNADFRATVADDSYTVPAKVSLENHSTGADFYQWTFEGGEPANSTEKTPPTVTYRQAGIYKITLEAWNDHERGLKEFTFSVDSAVIVSFDTEILVNDFAPAAVRITNTTQGASSFLWNFEGGRPDTSTAQHPADIFFEEAGEHTISLLASNGRETFSLSKKIRLADPIRVDFDIEPVFDDFDYEVPFTASLLNKTTGGLTYEWSATGGVITGKNSEHAFITIQDPGNYTITMEGGNGKETKTAEKSVTVTQNSNLYRMKDVKFGIKSAADIVGSFYSLSQRKVVLQNEVSESSGGDIDLVFFGINSTFEKCYFISPDLAGNAGFYVIPEAKQTYVVNDLQSSALTFTIGDFDAMQDDAPLQSLDIKSANQASSWFIALPVPRIVLFETAGGRKGAIKIKAFVSEQEASYILTDIKYQKVNVR